MQDFSKLLETKDSDLAWILRSSLCGLRATLQEAKKNYSRDRGISHCEELLNKLDGLLEIKPKLEILDDDSPLEPVTVTSQEILPLPEPQNQLKLSSFCDTLLRNKQLKNYLGDLQLQSKTDSELWKEIQFLLLRLPRNLADIWRQDYLKMAQEVGAREDKDRRSLIPVPYSRDDVLYPGLTGEIEAKGLSLSKELLEQEYSEISQNKDLFFLAGVVSTYRKFIEEHDTSLHHALKDVYRFGVISLKDPEQKSKYLKALENCWQRVQNAENQEDLIVTLRARLDLDEAIHSLVYSPPADRKSWWGSLQDQSRRTLDPIVEKVRHQGHKVKFRPLWGPFADIRTYSKDDLEIDNGGIKGEVVACLRVYAKIDDEELKGRVLFRSLR